MVCQINIYLVQTTTYHLHQPIPKLEFNLQCFIIYLSKTSAAQSSEVGVKTKEDNVRWLCVVSHRQPLGQFCSRHIWLARMQNINNKLTPTGEPMSSELLNSNGYWCRCSCAGIILISTKNTIELEDTHHCRCMSCVGNYQKIG